MNKASPITLHAAPSAGFDEPFEMLQACHERVERMLGLLERLAAHLLDHGAEATAQRAAVDVMRYFDVAGPAHHEDEERHLFPRLLAQGSAELQQVVGQMQHDHRTMTMAWAGVRRDLQAVVAAAWPPAGGADAAWARWSAFAAQYREHIAIEETQVYPGVRPLIDEPTLADMGDEMARRRGVR